LKKKPWLEFLQMIDNKEYRTRGNS